MIDLYNGDCLQVMDSLIEKGLKVDAVITDIPYGTTNCSWDSVIPFDKMWERLNLLIKDNHAIVLFGREPFSSSLRMSNIKNYKYDWKWQKRPVNFLNAKIQPLRELEDIMVFNSSIYYPQNLVKCRKLNKRSNVTSTLGKHNLENYSEYTNYPKEIIKVINGERGLHPTQKPVELMEYLVMTYTQEGETVLDFTMGSGSTGVACCMCNRNFIGIELDKNYFNIAKKRIEDEQSQGKLF